MSDGLSNVFIKLTMLEMENGGIPPELKTQFLYNVIEKRAEYIGLKLNEYVKAFLTCLVNTPGGAVMYLYYLKSKIKPEVNISLLEISMVFPMGFPSDLESHKLWDLQKVNNGKDNLLDLLDVSDW